MSYARYLGTTLLRRRQGFLGGFAYIKGQENTNKRDGFDVIANMTKEGYVLQRFHISKQFLTFQRSLSYLGLPPTLYRTTTQPATA